VPYHNRGIYNLVNRPIKFSGFSDTLLQEYGVNLLGPRQRENIAGATFSERSLGKSLVPIYSNPIMFAKDFSNKIFRH
jgi:hypothetical protein